MTNADRIRAMTDEELADWLKYERISVCPPDTGHIHCNISDICSDRKCWLDYLKQEVKDNEICCNDKCPMCADFCPVPYEPGVCRYEDRDGAEGGGEDG